MLCYLRADFIKMRRMPIQMAHLCIPAITSFIFLAYYATSSWDNYVKQEEFYRVIGMGFPFLIGLFCTMIANQEQEAGSFQNMLMVQKKYQPFLSKLLLLLAYAFGSLLLTSLLFGIGLEFWLHSAVTSLWFHPMVAILLLISSIPMYVLHLFLSFSFDKGVSIGVGIVETLLSVLLRTGGGSFWKFMPTIWPVRIVSVFLENYSGKETEESWIILQQITFSGVLLICILLVLYLTWARKWEGKRNGE